MDGSSSDDMKDCFPGGDNMREDLIEDVRVKQEPAESEDVGYSLPIEYDNTVTAAEDNKVHLQVKQEREVEESGNVDYLPKEPRNTVESSVKQSLQEKCDGSENAFPYYDGIESDADYESAAEDNKIQLQVKQERDEEESGNIDSHEANIKCQYEGTIKENNLNSVASSSSSSRIVPFDEDHGNESERRLPCNICNKTFGHASNLSAHKRTHFVEKSFDCNICEKTFRWASNLNAHKRIHTGEKPYKCDVCMKKFTNGSHLSVHKRIHIGEKPFECNFCMKKFTSGSHLNVHKRIHTNDKPFACNVCMKTFTQASNLRTHKRVMHNPMNENAR